MAEKILFLQAGVEPILFFVGSNIFFVEPTEPSFCPCFFPLLGIPPAYFYKDKKDSIPQEDLKVSEK
jgi:hypothetical protein